MIRGILFDLDGVLVNTHKLQSETTLMALENFCKKNNYIKTILNQTITTKEKLKILSEAGYIKRNQINKIYKLKKKFFDKKIINKKLFSKEKYNLISKLKKKGFLIAVVTNANFKTTNIILKKLKIKNFLNLVITNKDVKKNKPNPEPYLKAMKTLKLKKKCCIIFEDSPVGLLSARRSGAKVIKTNHKILLKNKILMNLL